LVTEIHREKRGDCVSVESAYKDIKQLRELINEKGVPTFLGGHSSGGGFVLNYSSWNKDTNFQGYIFISPEFGYNSKTAKKGRIDFAKVKMSKFLINAFSGGKLNQHSYAVELNYPREMLNTDTLIVSKLTVNMANALTPQNPKKQIANIDRPIAIYIGENDELFDCQKVVEYKTFQKNNSLKSFAEVVKNENHLSILLNIGDRIGKTIIEWSK
jgi:alpha-beta hydrolase superfamily lysophospholipase